MPPRSLRFLPGMNLVSALLTQALTTTAFRDGRRKAIMSGEGGQKALLWYGFYPPPLRYLRQEKHFRYSCSPGR